MQRPEKSVGFANKKNSHCTRGALFRPRLFTAPRCVQCATLEGEVRLALGRSGGGHPPIRAPS